MKIYLVICNGKISSEAYTTLKGAREFCVSRGAFESRSNSWVFRKGEDVYQIIDVQVISRTSQNDEVRE